MLLRKIRYSYHGRVVRRLNSTGTNNSGSGGNRGRGVVMTVLTAGTAVSAALGYSYVDPKFRTTVEGNLPFTKTLYRAFLGEAPSMSPVQVIEPRNISPSKPPPPKKTNEVKIEKKSTKKTKDEGKETVEVDVVRTATLVKMVDQSDSPSESSSKGSGSTTAKSSGGSGEAKNPSERKRSKSPANRTPNPYLGQENSDLKNQRLDDDLRAAISSAETLVRVATKSKMATIRALEHHVQTIREAVEAGVEGDWDAVTMAHHVAERKTMEDQQNEVDARAKVDQLKKVINAGAQGETTVLNPLLAISRETAKKLVKEIDDMNQIVSKVDTERIFVKDYRHLVEEGRKKFMLELRAVMPSADWSSAEEGKFTKKQLNALLAHAHLRVDQLRREIAQQKLEEEKKVRELVAERTRSLKVNIEKNVNVTHKTENSSNTSIENKQMKTELAIKIKQLEEKYDEKLKQVVVTQKQLYDIEHAKDLENAVKAERKIHAEAIGLALARLEGIEAALKSHVAMQFHIYSYTGKVYPIQKQIEGRFYDEDVENRRAKQQWLAAHNLDQSVVYGNKGSCCMEGRRLPLAAQLSVLMKTCPEDKFMKTLDAAVRKEAKQRGEYTKQDLVTRTKKALRVGSRVASMDENGGGAAAHIMAYLRSMLYFSLPIDYKKHYRFNAKSESNAALLDRARYYLTRDEMLNAVKVLQCTKGPTKRVTSGVVDDVRRHQETRLLVRLMVAHAAVCSIRTTY